MTADEAAAAGAGLHYRSREWREIADGGDWHGEWPEIDRRGILTGNAVGSVDCYLNVDDEAMIPVSEARAGGWQIDAAEGRAEPPQATVEVAAADETIRICGGLEDYAGVEHPEMPRACEAYRRAALDALEDDSRAGRLVADLPRGQRILHSAWAGTRWGYSRGAIGTMAQLTEDEQAAVSAADDAGREAARKVIEAAG
jgi:hypothetical protein